MSTEINRDEKDQEIEVIEITYKAAISPKEKNKNTYANVAWIPFSYMSSPAEYYHGNH